MFWDDIILVTDTIDKYGLRRPLVDVGGLDKPCIADYNRTIATGNQEARYLHLAQRPFDHIDPKYIILNPEKGDPFIEDLPRHYRFRRFGTILCLSVLEHVMDPFQIFRAIYKVLKRRGLFILSTVFEFPYHPSPGDYWRFSPEALRHLALTTGFSVLECDWRLDIEADAGILNAVTGKPQIIKSVYCVLTKGRKRSMPTARKGHTPLPTAVNATQSLVDNIP